MDPVVLLLVLGSAVLHASWNALMKVGGDPLIRLSIINLTCGLIALPTLFFVPLPDPDSWGLLAISVILHNIYYVLLVQSYKVGDLSFAYPLARGSAPLLVAILSFTFAGEGLSPLGIVAVSLICAAILSLALTGRSREAGWRPTLLALSTGVAIAAYTTSDGLGARASGHAIGYVMTLFVLECLPLVAFAAWRRGTLFAETFRRNWKPAFLAGFFAFLGYAIVVWALGREQMTFVSALRETSVIVAALIGTRLLGEPFGAKRVAAAAAVAAGVILLNVAPTA